MEKSKLIIASFLLIVFASLGYYIYIRQQPIEHLPQNSKDSCESINVGDVKKQVQAVESNITKYTTSSKDI